MDLYSGLMDLYISIFHEKGEPALAFMCRSSIARMVWLSKYKKMAQLSDMDEEQKLELKKYVNDLFKHEPPKFRLEACKIIFTINQCL